MTDSSKVGEDITVSCDVCLKEIPPSVAQIEEIGDYVLYFCGVDCYQKWQQENGKAAEKE